jgi:predicted small metal-binding protein
MKKIKEHAHNEHGLREIPSDIAQKVKTAIKDI